MIIVPAPLGRRAGAYLIDVAISFSITLVLSGLAFGLGLLLSGALGGIGAVLAGALVPLGALAWVLVYSALQGGAGSPGQRAQRLRAGDAATGAPLGFGRALLRNLVWALGGAIVVGYFSPLFDAAPARRGWHDRASGAVVLDRAASDAATAADAEARARADAARAAAEEEAAASAPPTLHVPTAPPRYAPVRGPGPLPPSPTAAPAPARPAAPAASAPRDADSPVLISRVPGITVDPPASAPVAPPAAADPPPARPAPGVPPAASAPPAPVAPIPEAAPAPAAPAAPASGRPVVVLTWDDGVRHAVHVRTFFGRNPAGEDGADVIAVRDETLSLSKTHFELGGTSVEAWIVDHGSTNGTVLLRDGSRRQLAAGIRTLVRTGDRLEFGDRTATVSGAP